MGWGGFGPTGREVAVLGGGFILEGGRKLEHEANQREGDRGHPSFWIKRFDAQGKVLHRVALRLSSESIIPPAFDDRSLALVPGGWGRHSRDGKRVDSSPGSSGTRGLQLLDLPGLLGMATATMEAGSGFTSNYSPVAILSIDGRQAGRNSEVGSYPALYRELPFFRWEFADGKEESHVQINALALAANAVVITRGRPAYDVKGRMSGFAAWTVAALDRDDGRVLWEHPLPSEPYLNALCIDRAGRVVVTLRDGGAVAFGAP